MTLRNDSVAVITGAASGIGRALAVRLANENIAGIVDALEAGGNSRVKAAVLPLLNHGFQTARTGRDDEYTQIEETMAPGAMHEIADFSYRPQGPRRPAHVEEKAGATSPAP